MIIPGIVRGICAANNDPTGQRRIKLQVPSLWGTSVTEWAPPCGVDSVPAVGTPVWVAFEMGEAGSPVWVGVAVGKVGGGSGSAPAPAGVLPGNPAAPYVAPKFDPTTAPAGSGTAAAFLNEALAQVGKPYVYGAAGPNEFDCLVGDTLIQTSRGERPISQIKVGELVVTRKGWRKVQRVWLARKDAKIVEVALSSGGVLRGTPDHRVFTINRGWVPLSRLRSFDTLVCEDAEKSLAGFLEGSTARSRVTSIIGSPRGAGSADVYDLSVEDAHEFFANGVLVHNCSGLVQYCLIVVGITNAPRNSEDQFAWCTPTTEANLVPGDLIFEQWSGDNDPPGHVIIYDGGGQVIEAPETGQNVHVRAWSPTETEIVGYGSVPGLTYPPGTIL